MERNLRAILSADVEGYSRLMETDEEATIRTLKMYREAAGRHIEEHKGDLMSKSSIEHRTSNVQHRTSK